MARSEGYLGSKIDQKTHPSNQKQVHRAATSFLAGETVGFCADAHAGPIRPRYGAWHSNGFVLCFGVGKVGFHTMSQSTWPRYNVGDRHCFPICKIILTEEKK